MGTILRVTRHRIITVIVPWIPCFLLVCTSPENQISTQDFLKVELIQTGYYYPVNWEMKPAACECENPNSEPCTLFCNALKSVSKIKSLPGNQALKLILKNISIEIKSPDSILKEYVFIGAGAMLYFFNSPTEDERIRKHLLADTQALRLFFGASGRISRFAWIYNRPDKNRWKELIDSVNTKHKWIKPVVSNSTSDGEKGLLNMFDPSRYSVDDWKYDSVDYSRPMEAIKKEIALIKQ